jgi:hypothetical protein
MKLADWHRRTLYATGAALWGTGVAWLAAHYLLASSNAFGRVPNPWEARWRLLHGVSSAVALYVFGTLLVPHMLKAWAMRRSRVSGTLVAAVIFTLAVTGLGLYYVGDDAWREATSLAHWAIGLGAPALVAFHVVVGRRKQPPPRFERGSSDRSPES